MFGFLKIFVDNKWVASFGPNIMVRFILGRSVQKLPRADAWAVDSLANIPLSIPTVAGESCLASLTENNLDRLSSVFKRIERLGIF
jgi:hypothetical protein